MRYVLENVPVSEAPAAIDRLGIGRDRHVRIVLDVLGLDLPLATAAMEGGAFAFLDDEPDLYDTSDIQGT